MRLGVSGFVLTLLLILPADFLAQAPPPPPPPVSPGEPRDPAAQKTGTAQLSGRVTALDTGRPIRRAVVRVTGPELRESKSVSTDPEGRWELREIPAGRFSINVSKGGYVSLAYGQLRPFGAGKPVEVTAGQSVEKLDVALPRGGAITGRVVDEAGEPVTGANVVPMRFRATGGQRRLLPYGVGDSTDDLGQFRLYGLAPADYYVSVQPVGFAPFGASDDRTGYVQTFYPAAVSPSGATRVPLAIGQEAQNIVITLSPMRMATLSGTAITSQRKPVAQGIVMLRDNSPSGRFESNAALVQNGTWLMSGVAPGDYLLVLQHIPNLEPLPPGWSIDGVPGEVAREAITVAGDDMRGITLVTSPGGSASGVVRFGDAPPPASVPAGLTVQGLEDSEMPIMPPGGSVQADWTFISRGLSGHRMLRVIGLPPGWHVQSILADGADVIDTGLDFQDGRDIADIEIVLTRTAAELSGTVQDSKGTAATDYVVVIFPPESDKWGWQSRYVKVGRPDQTGRFLITGLPAASYLAVALEYLEPGEESNPEYLERLKGLATSVRVSHGEKKSITLKISGG